MKNPAYDPMLGYSSVKVTEIYMNSLPSNTLDDFNEKVLKGLKPTSQGEE